MRIAICGSMATAEKMVELGQELGEKGHTVILPEGADKHASGEKGEEDKWDKIEMDVFKSYFEEIKDSDAIIVVNQDKHGIENYVGANSLIEMAFAHVLDREIYLLNPVPDMRYTDEIEAMEPEVLEGDLSILK